MNTPTDRRGTRLISTFSVLLGIVTIVFATIASMRGHAGTAVNFCALGVVLAGAGLVGLVEANRAAKR